MAKKEIALELKREEVIRNLLLNPVENELYTITFVKKSLDSGEVFFKHKETKKLIMGLWSVLIVGGEIITDVFEMNIL